MRELTRPSRLMASNLMLSDHLRKLAATILMVQTMESPRRQGEFATEWRQSAFGRPFCLVWSRKTVDGEEFDGLKPSETVDAEGFSCFGSSKSVVSDDFDGLMEQKGLATKVFLPGNRAGRPSGELFGKSATPNRPTTSGLLLFREKKLRPVRLRGARQWTTVPT